MDSGEVTSAPRQDRTCCRRVGRPLGGRVLPTLLAVLAVAAGGGFHCAQGAWTTQVIDSQHPAGSGTSIAVQPTGQVHVGYQGGTGELMKYATNAYGVTADPVPSWMTVQGVASVPAPRNFTGQNSAVAVGADGVVHACYYSTYPIHAIMYASNSSGTWQADELETNGNVYSAIAVDGDNRVHVLTITDTGRIRYWLRDAQGTWATPQTLPDGNCNGYVQIVADPGGHAHAVYASGGNLMYATNASGSWSAGTAIDASVSLNIPISLVLDAAGHAHVAYLEQTSHELRYATNAPDGTWKPAERIDDAQNDDVIVSSITTDAQGNATIDYFSRIGLDIKRATRTGGAWQAPTVRHPVSDAAISDPAIATDRDGNVHLVYTDASTGTGQLKYVTDAPGPRGADVQVTQAVSGTIIAGRPVIYTVTVTNLGADPAAGVVLVDSLPAGCTFVSADGGATFDPAKNQVTRNIGAMDKGVAVTTNITVLASFDSSMTNLAEVKSDGADFKSANDTASQTNDVLPVPEHPLVLGVANSVGGTLAANDNRSAYAEGSIVPVTATPDPGYRVKKWSGTLDDASTGNTNSVQIGEGERTTVQVEFEKIPRQLIAVAAGNGSIDPLSAIRPDGERVTLTATPDRHYRVRKWTGTDHDDWTGNTNTVLMNADRQVTVEFEQAPNQEPFAVIQGPDSVDEGERVILDASGSSDPDGDALTYKWEITDEVQLDSTSQAITGFTAPSGLTQDLMLNVTLTVSDGLAIDQAWKTIKVRPGRSDGCGQGVGPINLVGFYALCAAGLVCMKLGHRRRSA